jgi:hypothetical protein
MSRGKPESVLRKAGRSRPSILELFNSYDTSHRGRQIKGQLTSTSTDLTLSPVNLLCLAIDAVRCIGPENKSSRKKTWERSTLKVTLAVIRTIVKNNSTFSASFRNPHQGPSCWLDDRSPLVRPAGRRGARPAWPCRLLHEKLGRCTPYHPYCLTSVIPSLSISHTVEDDKQTTLLRAKNNKLTRRQDIAKETIEKQTKPSSKPGKPTSQGILHRASSSSASSSTTLSL